MGVADHTITPDKSDVILDDGLTFLTQRNVPVKKHVCVCVCVCVCALFVLRSNHGSDSQAMRSAPFNFDHFRNQIPRAVVELASTRS